MTHIMMKDVDGMELAKAFLEAFPIGSKTLRRPIDEWLAERGLFSIEVSQDTLNFNFNAIKDKINRVALSADWAEQELPSFQLQYRNTTSTGQTEWEVIPVEVAFEVRALAGVKQKELQAKHWQREVRRIQKMIDSQTSATEVLKLRVDHVVDVIDMIVKADLTTAEQNRLTLSRKVAELRMLVNGAPALEKPAKPKKGEKS